MNQKPLVSVICTCFNHENFVVETLNSVLKQTYSNIEIIIIDDSSLDDSLNVIENWLKDQNEIIFIKNNLNLGNTKTFNKAVKFANGSFLIDLSCDDKLLPNCIELQIDTFLKNNLQTTGIVFGNSENIDVDGNFISNYFSVNEQNKVLNKELFKTDLQRILKGGLCMNSVSSMINKSVFDELNGFDESLMYEDLDFWLRVLDKHQIVFIDEIITQKRSLKTSLGSQFYKKSAFSNKMDDSTFKIFIKVFRKYISNKTILKALLKRIHNSMENSFKNKKWPLLIRLSFLKLKVNFYILLAK